MAENKQYINHIQENGNVLISEDVVATIVAQAIKEVEGVVSYNLKTVADIADMIGKKSWGRGIRVEIAEDNSLVIDCDIQILYGQSVVEIAKSVQSVVATQVESMTGEKVTAVNVNVCGILRQ